MAVKKEKYRIGIGYDVHRLVKNRPLIIGGVEIAHKMGLLGHSDADVLCHAVCDSLLGAVNAGDIGQHFPNNDPEYSGISSLKLLSHVASLVKKTGYRVLNIDTMVIAESPRLSTYIPEMKKAMSHSLQIALSQISIKATTNEKLGDIGRGKGICAYANAMVERTK
jgi:2-C-methyl-D-erythritol 2,4-cyclodiphosphate synthase